MYSSSLCKGINLTLGKDGQDISNDFDGYHSRRIYPYRCCDSNDSPYYSTGNTLDIRNSNSFSIHL
jgi:hypothetical protein